MDPITAVGLLSSIAQLAEGSFKIVKLLETIREGGKERRKLCDEIMLLWMNLRNLETQFSPLSEEQDGPWMRPIDSLAEPGGVFQQTSQALDEIWDKLTTSESFTGKVKQTLRWPFDKEDVEKTIARIERLKSSMAIVLGQANIALAQEMREDGLAKKKIAENDRFKDIVDWLSPLNFRQKQENITGTPGTGEWFFREEEFQQWESGPEHWLWCYGIPGAGKTVLASTTVDELRRLHGNEKVVVLVAFCSFDSPDSQSVDLLMASFLKQLFQIRGSITKEAEDLYVSHSTTSTRPPLSEICKLLDAVLSEYERCYIVLDALDELFDESKRLKLLESIKGLKANPKLMVTSRQLDSIGSLFGEPLGYIVCNGCGNDNMEVYHHCDDCKDIDACEDCLKNGVVFDTDGGHYLSKRFSSVKIQIAAQPEDIESYINKRIEIEYDLRRFVERRPGLREQILETVVEKAKEMFLLAKFHMDSLVDCLTVGEVLDALDHLPKEINHTYDQAMARIEKLSANRQRAVKKLLLWVTYAERPLKIAELEHATAIARGMKEIGKDYILSGKVLTSMSAGMVIIDESEYVRLTHETAEGYFKEKRKVLFPAGETEIAESCIAYLQLEVFDQGPCTGPDEAKGFEERWKVHPFLGYAALYWGNHAKRSHPDIVTPQAMMFLRNASHLAASVQALWYTDTQSADSWDVQGEVAALHIAAFFGLTDIVSSLLFEGADASARDSFGTTPLIYAASKGHADVVDILLRAGAPASDICGRGSTALHRASKQGHTEAVGRLLKERDVAVNALWTSWSHRSALMMACSGGHTEVVKLLLTRTDIEINQETPTPRGWTALFFAGDMDYKEIVELLLKHPRIEVDHQDRAGYTALIYAACWGFVGVVEALLDGGADPEIEDDQGGRAIQRAIDDNEYAVVKLLLQRNVEYNFRDTLGRTLLHSAACNDRTSIIRLLLQTCKDLDINAQGNAGETALHDSVRINSIETTKALLEFGARTDIPNKAGRTPVRLAKDAGHTRILEVLQKARENEVRPVHKADTFKVDSEIPLWMAVQNDDLDSLRERIQRASLDELNQFSPDSNDTSLHLACQHVRPEVVQMLLEAGAFVDPLDTFSRTPLVVACQWGDLEIVKLLVSHGADLNSSVFRDQPPWDLALSANYPSIALFLIAQGAYLDPSNDRLHQALQWAAVRGDLEAAKRLVKAGASVQLKSADGFTPIQTAKHYEKHDVEQYLFEEAARQRSSSSPSLLQKESHTPGVEKSLELERQEIPPLSDKSEEPPTSEQSKKLPLVGEPEDKPVRLVKAAESAEPIETPPINLQPLINPSREQGHLRQLLLSRNYLFLSLTLVVFFATVSRHWIGWLSELVVQNQPSQPRK